MRLRWRRLWLYLLGRTPTTAADYPRYAAWRFLEACLLLLDAVFVPEFLMALHQVCKPHTRRLTSAEIDLARSIFGKSIDYQKVRIDEHARIGCKKYRFAYVSFQIINHWGPLSAPHFIHEMVHIWQYQRLGSIYIPRALYAQRTPQGYNYGGIPGLRRAYEQGRGLTDFNFEQQGDIVADYFCLKMDYTPRWCPKDQMYLVDFEKIIKNSLNLF